MKQCQGCGCYVTEEQADISPRVAGFTTLCETCAEGLGAEKVPKLSDVNGLCFEEFTDEQVTDLLSRQPHAARPTVAD